MEEFLSNDSNKQALIHMIADRLRQKVIHVIHAERDADVDIVTTAVTMSSDKSTTLIGEDTDLLVLLLYHGSKGCISSGYLQDSGAYQRISSVHQR